MRRRSLGYLGLCTLVLIGGAMLQHPLHPYTAGMLSSTIVGHKRGTRIEAIPGTPPTCAACPQDAASRHAVRMPSLPVQRHFPRSGIARQDVWPAACACTRTISRR
jgi:ABC-type dipeptide/oligopeptide/nickel transport system ATPase component